jgi:hypothetical protein
MAGIIWMRKSGLIPHRLTNGRVDKCQGGR